eukprot:6087278-Prymnesium_polylepis.1
MPGRTKNNARPVNGSARQTTMNWGVRDGHWRYASSISSVPRSSVQLPSTPRCDAKAGPTRTGKSARSHVIVTPSEVHSLCLLAAASSHG